MKKIGLIGGMSWASSLDYYRIINSVVNQKLGGQNSAEILMHSFNFQEISDLMYAAKWDELSQKLVDVAVDLENNGAEIIAMCANTPHKLFPQIEKSLKSSKLLHIADAVALEIQKNNLKKVLLLGTKFTMEESFYKDRLLKFGLEVVVPQAADIKIINDIIYQELVNNIISFESKIAYQRIINSFKNYGVQAAILGCTEIGLLIKENDVEMKIFDTAKIHALTIAQMSIK
jgi:aspartate racemase